MGGTIGGCGGGGSAADSQEHRSRSRHLRDALFQRESLVGFFFPTKPQPGRALAVWSFCQLSRPNGGAEQRVWLLLKLTDWLHLLSELCHMLECTTWLRRGRGGSHSGRPSILSCALQMQSRVDLPHFPSSRRSKLPPQDVQTCTTVIKYQPGRNDNEGLTSASPATRRPACCDQSSSNRVGVYEFPVMETEIVRCQATYV